MPNLLFEIGTEEIPASYVARALQKMEDDLRRGLETLRLRHGKIVTFATPRRLTIFVEKVAKVQKDREDEVIGPPCTIAFAEDGAPKAAAIGFAKRFGLGVEHIRRVELDRGFYCAVTVREPGRPAADVVPPILCRIPGAIPFPKSMWWDDRKVTFARPVRYLAAILGRKVLPVQFAGLVADRLTYGHPFLSPGPITLPEADLMLYRQTLRRAHVLVDPQERRDLIAFKVNAISKPHGAELQDYDLLDEVADLVEFPGAIQGSFDESFLEVPAPVIEAALMGHQRYFPVRDVKGDLLPHFIIVTNRRDEDSHIVRAGNERVLRARLSDARYFWQQDRRRRLDEFAQDLRQVSFLPGMGTLHDKAGRLGNIADRLAEMFSLPQPDRAALERAAALCKADLLTEMVGEFPELQGVMGGEYARAQEEEEDVCLAIADHYLPPPGGERYPRHLTGVILAMADRLDNLVACFALGLEPTGSSDPHALRRQALGIIHMSRDLDLEFSLRMAVHAAAGALPPDRGDPAVVADRVLAFIRDRIEQTYADTGADIELVRATLRAGFDDLRDIKARIDALSRMARLPTWSSLVTIVERTFKIQKDQPGNGEIREDLLSDKAEKRLWETYCNNQESIRELIRMRKYEQASVAYNRIFGSPIDKFFEKVFVNVKEEDVRRNRILLLRHVYELYGKSVADLSQIPLPAVSAT